MCAHKLNKTYANQQHHHHHHNNNNNHLPPPPPQNHNNKANNAEVSFVGEAGNRVIDLDTCTNGAKDGTETDVDCGGHCGVCDVGSACEKATDCDRQCIDKKCTNAAQCKDLGDAVDKPGVYEVVFEGDDEATEVFCVNKGQLPVNDDGKTNGPSTSGWTLLATAQPRNNAGEWNHPKRARIVNDETFGSVEKNRKEFKATAYSRMEVTDLMFYLYAQDKNLRSWAHYADVTKADGNKGTLAEIIKSFGGAGGNFCWQGKSPFPLTAGSLQKKNKMCDTHLYFNSYDQDGGGCAAGNNAYGPHWNGGDNNGCPMDDPGGFSSFFGLEQSNRYVLFLVFFSRGVDVFSLVLSITYVALSVHV